MILDLKRFTPGSDLPPGLLWVAEQIPGLVASGDMTEQLARGYWPSYNVPYFPEVICLPLAFKPIACHPDHILHDSHPVWLVLQIPQPCAPYLFF